MITIWMEMLQTVSFDAKVLKIYEKLWKNWIEKKFEFQENIEIS